MTRRGRCGKADRKKVEKIMYLLHRVFLRIKVDHTWKILPTVLITW